MRMKTPYPSWSPEPLAAAGNDGEGTSVVAAEARGDDLICVLSDGRTVAADWRQIWTYRRMEHGDDTLAIAGHALMQAPDIFSISHVRINQERDEAHSPWLPQSWFVQFHKGVSMVAARIDKFGFHPKAK